MPVNNPPRAQDYDNAHADLQTIEDVVNGGPSATVTSRLGRVIKSLAYAIESIIDGSAFIAKLSGVQVVDTDAALAAQPGEVGRTYRVRGKVTAGDGGGRGVFYWDGSDLSAAVAADPQAGVYIPLASDPTGASGAYVLNHKGKVNIRWCGAVGGYDDNAMTGTDDFDAVDGARSVAEFIGTKTIFVPPGKFGTSEPVVFDGDNWVIYGIDKNNTMLVAINDDDIFQVDCRTAISYRGTIKGICFRRRSATYENTAAIRVLADAGSPTGMRHWTIQDIMLRGVAYGVWHERTALAVSAGINQISWHGFNMYLNIDVPVDFDGRYPINVIGWEGGNGPHHLIQGGQYRAEESCVKMGNGDEFEGVGDFVMTGVHCVLGAQAVEVIGPSGATTYRFNFAITACQFDVLTAYLLKLSNVGFFRFIGNNFLTGVDHQLTNVINYTIEGPSGIVRQGQGGIVDTFNIPTVFSQSMTHNGSRFTQNGWLSLGAGATVTIASGAITATRSSMIVDTEGGAASDDLDTINGGTDGDILEIVSANSARDVTVKHATGNIRLNGAADKALTSVSDAIWLKRRGGIWCQIAFSDNFA